MFSYMAYDPETKTATDDRVYETMINNEEAIYHLWPFNYCTDRYLLTTYASSPPTPSKAKAKYFTYRCKKFVLQYFVLKPVLTIFIMALHPFLGSRSVVRSTSTPATNHRGARFGDHHQRVLLALLPDSLLLRAEEAAGAAPAAAEVSDHQDNALFHVLAEPDAEHL